MILALAACLPLPAPDFRRPAALVVIEGESAGVSVRTCTWSTRHSPLEGCEDITDGMPAEGGIGIPEWAPWPLVLGTESPRWADAFVACKEGKFRGAMLRLPGIPVKWKAQVDLRLDHIDRLGASARIDLDDATATELGGRLCAGTATRWTD